MCSHHLFGFPSAPSTVDEADGKIKEGRGGGRGEEKEKGGRRRKRRRKRRRSRKRRRKEEEEEKEEEGEEKEEKEGRKEREKGGEEGREANAAYSQAFAAVQAGGKMLSQASAEKASGAMPRKCPRGGQTNPKPQNNHNTNRRNTPHQSTKRHSRGLGGAALQMGSTCPLCMRN